MADVILHHYPQSPVAEKVRMVIGMKGLDWRSVHIPRLPPKPELMPLTGGYRRTPVMQIGANVYCDSCCIIRELEQRFAEPSLFPDGNEGLIWGLSSWTDGPVFTSIIAAVFGEQGDSLPAEFISDRGRLYFGPEFTLQRCVAELPEGLAQLRTQFTWLARSLEDGRAYLAGDRPGLIDALCYHLVWFFRGRVNAATSLLKQLPRLEAWERRVAEIGHGRPEPLEAAEALAIARASTPAVEAWVDADDPLGLTRGRTVGITPVGDGGDPTVTGRLIRLTTDTVAVHRNDDRVGDVIVHFPRIGYRLTAAGPG